MKNNLYKYISIVFFLFTVTIVKGQDVPVEERQALIDLYNATNGDNWQYGVRTDRNRTKVYQFADKSNSGNKWLIDDDNSPVSTWEGVRVRDGHVIDINLESANLVGEIPDSISNLNYLEYLNFSNNSEITQIPDSIYSINTLFSLELKNVFADNVSVNIDVIYTMSELENLDLRNAYRNSEIIIKEGFFDLIKLEYLFLYNVKSNHWNKLNKFTNLHTIYIEDANIIDLPDSFGDIPIRQLCFLDCNLSSNDLEITLRNKLLYILVFNENTIEDNNVFNSFSGLNYLSSLGLRNNNIELDNLPPILGTLNSLRTLDIGNNNIKGSTKFLSNLTNFFSLGILENNFVFSDLDFNLTKTIDTQRITEGIKEISIQTGNALTIPGNSRLQHSDNTYQWYKRKGSGFQAILEPNGKQRDLIIPNSQLSDSGDYFLRVRNPAYTSTNSFVVQSDTKVTVNEQKTGNCDILENLVDGSFEAFRSIPGANLPGYSSSDNVLTSATTGNTGNWFNGKGSADLFLPPINAVCATNMSSSPAGGVFLGLAGPGEFRGSFPESFYVSLSNLEVSKIYKVGFYQANGGYETNDNEPQNSGGWQIRDFNNNDLTKMFDQSEPMDFRGVGNQVWEYVELEFTAISSSLDLEFIAFSTANNLTTAKNVYMAIDDIRVFLKGSKCDQGNPNPTLTCTQQPYNYIEDLPIPNNGSTVVWYESNTDEEINQLPGFEEEPYDLDEEVAPGQVYWAEVDGNQERVSFQVPESPDVPGTLEEEYQAFPPTQEATVADLQITPPSGVAASEITWHNSMTSTSQLAPTTVLQDGLYYAAVNGDACRFIVEVEIFVRLLSPVEFQRFCAILNPTIGDLAVYEDYGLEVRWYNQLTDGEIFDTTTALVDGQEYFGVLYDGEMESEERISVQVTLNDVPAPVLETEELTVFINKNEIPTVNDIILPGAENIEWYASLTATVPLSSEDVIEDGVTYYASQKLTGELCSSDTRLEATIRIEIIPPPKIILCEKFRPEVGEKYVFSGWVRQLGLKENTSVTKTIQSDAEAKKLLIDLMNHIVTDFVYSDSGKAIDRYLEPVYIPSPGTRKFDPLRNYVIDAPTDVFTLYNFKYITDGDQEYPIVTDPTSINNSTETRRVRRTIGFQFSFKPYANPNSYDVQYLTPIYDTQENRRYPLFNNPTLNLEFNDLQRAAGNGNQVQVKGDFSIDKGATNYINSNSVSSTLAINNLRFSQDFKTFRPDPNYQVEEYTNSLVEILYEDKEGNELLENSKVTFETSGQIIDGWQRIYASFIVPVDAGFMTIKLKNTETSNDVNAYFDDIRVHPYDSNLKSFVYDPITQRLQAELDENNYATFYEYDNEGGLIRVKKETERGVYTIQETRSSTRISRNN